MITKRRSTRNKDIDDPNINQDDTQQICLSQNIIVQSICDQSLLDPSVESILPSNLQNIYNLIMTDLSFINNIQAKKNYNFYKCNMTYFKGEETGIEKKKAILELIMKNRIAKTKRKIIPKLNTNLKKQPIFKHRKKVVEHLKINKCEKNKITKVEDFRETLKLKKSMTYNISEELRNDWISEKQNKKRSFIIGSTKEIKSTKLLTSKLKEGIEIQNSFSDRQNVLGKLIERNIHYNNEMRSIEENKLEELKYKKGSFCREIENLENNNISERLVESKRNNKRKTQSKFWSDQSFTNPKVARICRKVEKINDFCHSNDNEVIDLSSEDSIEDSVNVKSKVYFREPIQRKQSAINSKKLKEHTLLDKIMLGINCVRQWNENGLCLTKVTENDLGLLNKRLASVKCTMSELEEHTDENNNKSLSVLIQSEMFTNLPPVILKPTPVTKLNHDETKHSPVSPDCNFQSTRPKSKHHISSMYRHRYNLPSILSKPNLSQESNFKKNVPKPHALPRFSEGVKVDDNVKILTETADNQLSDPSMSASQLLRMKSQNAFNSNMNVKSSILEEHQQSLPTVQITKVSHSAGIISLKPTIIYQSMPRNNFVLPLQLAHSKLIRFPKSSFRIPLSKTIGSESIRLTNISKFQNVPTNTTFLTNLNNVPRLDNNSNFTQPSILKNLLQQSDQQVFPSRHANLSSSRMVPLSVFQSNKTKWQVGSVSQYHAKK